MKIGIFTDSHYSSQEITCGNRFNSRSLKKISQAYDLFVSEKCDWVVCLGDLIDNESCHEKEIEHLKEIAEVMQKSPIQTICLMGNHDAFAFTEAEFYDLLKIPKPDRMEKEGKTFLFLDACYCKSGRHYLPGDTDWTDTFYPHTEAFKKQLEDAAGEVYIFIHQNIDPNIPEPYRLYNFEEIHHILQASGKVKAVYQGHYHPGKKSRHHHIEYVSFSAMCEQENAWYILHI